MDKVPFLAFDNINMATPLNDIEKKINFTITGIEFIQSLKDLSEELRKQLYNMEPEDGGKYVTL